MAQARFSKGEIVQLRNKFKAKILDMYCSDGKWTYKVHVFEKADGSSFDWIPNQLQRNIDLVKIK